MMAQRFYGWISDQLHRAIKVGLPIAAALSFCVRTYGGGNELLFDAIPSGQLRKAQAALAQGIDANVTRLGADKQRRNRERAEATAP